MMLPPHSQIGPLTDDERAALIKKSTIYGKYDQYFDRYSAYEKLRDQAAASENQLPPVKNQPTPQPSTIPAPKTAAPKTVMPKTTATRTSSVRKQSSGAGTAILKTVVNTLGSRQGQQLIRGLFGSLVRK
jgi:hypothetical protein